MAEQAFPFNADFIKIMQDFRIPGVDAEALWAAQRRNLEAVAQVNQAAIEGAQAVARRQAEILQSSLGEAAEAARAVAEADPADKLAKQTELAKTAFDTAVANMRELSEMVVKAQGAAFETINKRVAEGLDEVRSAADKAQR